MLLALWLPTLWFQSPWPFMLLTLILISAAAWEWARLNGLASRGGWVGGIALAAAGLLAVGCAARAARRAGAVVAGRVRLDRRRRLGVAGRAPALAQRCRRGVRIGVGLALLGVAWLALAQARIIGVNYLLSVLCVVWMADIAAYFGGRTFGRRKLAPTISPGKSWEGVVEWHVGRAAAVRCVDLAIDARVATDSASLFTLLKQRYGVPVMVLAVLGLVAMSVVGDLFESLIKRAVGAKDSSGLLPGHGGVLDRIDALAAGVAVRRGDHHPLGALP